MPTISSRAEWNAIGTRIEGVTRATEFFFRTIRAFSEDSYDALQKILLPQSQELYNLIHAYNEKYATALPLNARDCLSRFLTTFHSNFKSEVQASGLNGRLQILQIRLTAVNSLRTELEFCLTGLEERIRTATERAFLHLQRLIIVDDEYKVKWKAAYEKGELICENLGAVHLLWHGIWAFKVNADGARTDLVTGNRIDNPTKVEQTALGMVLTEWKKVTLKDNPEEKFKSGRVQASLYASGILGGVELAGIRYIIAVSLDYVLTPPDDITDNLTYKYLNIAVQPRTPAPAAKRMLNQF